MTEQKRGRGRPRKIQDDPRMPKFGSENPFKQMERTHGMTEQKRGRGQPKKTVEQAVYPEKAVYDWKDLAFKVQDALESSIQENKELEKEYKDVCIIAIKQQGVIEYLEELMKKHKPTEEEIERNNDPV